MMPRAGHSAIPRTPTSASSSILMSSPSAGAVSDFFQIKQEEIEYQLLSPISSSSGTRIIKVTPTTMSRRSTTSNGHVNNATKTDHEYFSTPITPSTGTPSSRVYLTPTGGSPSTANYAVKVEARRRLNLDSAAATVDQDGFKTPIKGTKRKHDFSSPSPKKRKASKHYFIYILNFFREIDLFLYFTKIS